MRKHLISEDKNHQQPKAFENPLEEILREGARRLLQEAIENEVEEYLQMFLSEREREWQKSNNPKWISSRKVSSNRNWTHSHQTTAC